jgi:hypothetical protein
LAARAIAMFETSPRAARSSSVSAVRCSIVSGAVYTQEELAEALETALTSRGATSH